MLCLFLLAVSLLLVWLSLWFTRCVSAQCPFLLFLVKLRAVLPQKKKKSDVTLIKKRKSLNLCPWIINWSYLSGPIFVSNKLYKHCVLTRLVREEGVLWGESPDFLLKCFMVCHPPHSPRCPTRSIGGWIVTTAPDLTPRVMPLVLTHGWWGRQKKNGTFSLSVLWRCKSWHMKVMTDRGGCRWERRLPRSCGFICDQDIVYNKVYEGLKWGRVSQVEELVPSSIWWHHRWSNWPHVFSSYHRWPHIFWKVLALDQV